MTTIISYLLKNKTFILGVILAIIISALFLDLKYTQIKYEKQVSSLKTEILEYNKATMEATKKQEEYIDRVYKEVSKLNVDINKSIKESNDEIKNWSDNLVADITTGVRTNLKTDISNSTTKALENSRTSLRDTAIILNQKFSKEVSRNLIELVADAERNRVALGQCIKWADNLKDSVEK